MTNHSVILEAPDDACGYLNSMERARFGCPANSEKCAIYYPTSSMAATRTIDATMIPMITPAPQPSIVCCEPSRGDCIVQPTACVDTIGDCTGICSNDPMTLKCTTGGDRHCNRAHFESPLYFRHMEALDAEMRPADTPADGWFCGPSAIPIEHGNESQPKSVSMGHKSHGSASLSATLSVTITMSKPALQPAHPLGLPLPGAVVSGDTDCEDDAHGSDDCCFDEPGSDEPCYDDAYRARLRQRYAVDGSTINDALPAAASAGPITRGSAIVSTAYIGQTDRAPFVEATRPWSLVIPTAVVNSTKNDTSPRPRRPKPPKSKKHRLGTGGRTAITVLVPTAVVLLIVVYVWRKYGRSPIPRQQGAEQQQQQQHVQDESRPDFSRRLRRFIEENYGRIGTSLARPNQRVTLRPSPAPYGFRYEDMPRRPQPAHERDQHASPESGEAADDEEESGLHSEDFVEREAHENPVGVASSQRRRLIYDHGRG